MGVNVQFDGVQRLMDAFPCVLLLDGNDEDRESLARLLAETHFDVVEASTVAEAKDILASRPIDAVVLDPELADGNGMDLAWDLTIRNMLFFVLARGDDPAAADRAYARGATDFSLKPVIRTEWLARLRRSITARQRTLPAGASSRLRLLHEEMICLLDGRTYQLTPHERDLIACLLDAEGQFARYEEVIRAIWPDKEVVDRQHVRVLVAQTRRKLERDGGKPLIRTVTGKGLKLSL